MIGLDSGFFFRRAEGHPGARQLFDRVRKGQEEAAVSSVTIFGLLRHGLRGALPCELTEMVTELTGEAFVLAGVDEKDVLRRAAAVAHGMRLPMADATIAASLEQTGCTQLYTTDHDFDGYEGPMHVVFL